MIISNSHKFAFIKGRKVAGTSVEVGLSSLCDADDILTPISPIDEVLRLKTTGRIAQNYGADPKKLERFRKTLLASNSIKDLDWSSIRKPRGRYAGHMSFIDMERTFGGFSDDWTIIAITRCPYEQALSRIKHMANKEAVRERSEAAIDVESSYFQEAKTKFINKAANKKTRLNISLYKDSANNLRPNFYLRYENLNSDYKRLLEKLGQTNAPELPHLKKTSTTKRTAAQDLFERQELDIINACFEEEFQQYNYQAI